jgi:hypothetical protein
MRGMKRTSIPKACALAAFLAFQSLGCGRQSANQAVDDVLKKAGKSRETVFPLAGKITIDGHAPELKPGARMFVMLHNRDKLDTPTGPILKTVCKPNGEFAFSTYLQGDGVPVGKYVVTVAQLRQGFRQGYIGPDALKNLYNDPEANAKIEEFLIDHKPPGKTDCAFDLKIAGLAPASPGPHAVTKIRP